MKKRILLLSILYFLLFSFINQSYAHPGRTDSSWGHTCRTNCDSWWYSYGQYHYHGWYTSPTYNPSYTTPTINCPLNSYKSWTSCYCNSWYIKNDVWTGCRKETNKDNAVWYYLVKLNDSKDTAIIMDKNKTFYTIEYGIGCLSMSLYEEDIIYIYKWGTFLDGISDHIYLPDNKWDCKIWDAEELDLSEYQDTTTSNTYSYWNSTWTSTKQTTPTCPLNSTYNSNDKNCYCNTWYKINSDKTECIEKTTSNTCIDTINGYYDKKQDWCYCNVWYEWWKSENKCTKKIEKTEDKYCIENYWKHSYGDKNKSNTCYCKKDYIYSNTLKLCTFDIDPELKKKWYSFVQLLRKKIGDSEKKEKAIISKLKDIIKKKPNHKQIKLLKFIVEELQEDDILTELDKLLGK